jgi:hypothetical protein
MTWITERKAKVLATGDKKLYEAFSTLGWGVSPNSVPFRNMIRALHSMPWMNSAEDNERLEAAEYVRKKHRKVA